MLVMQAVWRVVASLFGSFFINLTDQSAALHSCSHCDFTQTHLCRNSLLNTLIGWTENDHMTLICCSSTEVLSTLLKDTLVKQMLFSEI